MNAATLALEDGTVLRGEAFGAQADAVFELVFNTSLSGYQEILTDPSYRGQGVLFTCPHIGNVGVNREDCEAERPQVSAAVVRSISPAVSNWRAEKPLAEWLAEAGIPGISGVDTRFLTRRLRDGGTQKAALSTRGADPQKLLETARAWEGLDGRDMVSEISCPREYAWAGDPGSKWVADGAGALKGKHILAYDFGMKRNILRHLASEGARVTVVPSGTPAKKALALKPDGIFLSNGPGDPRGLPKIVAAVRSLLESGIPTLGICLGHQLIGLALEGRIAKLKFGHHGGNHPVRDEGTRGVWITAQNHNYIVEAESLPKDEAEVTMVSLNDGSVEGLRLKRRPVFCVQFHPEASPGPHDAREVFGRFFAMVVKGGD
ncbi:MAG: glutamine-hydrolyzing carbamoyl-phosphate synthase small subunit [Anaerolineales bacterium]|nr:glutamine-hydrolyzing carbamoyl-phosphate synthase small subunit [Anaerolineales bacterium]